MRCDETRPTPTQMTATVIPFGYGQAQRHCQSQPMYHDRSHSTVDLAKQPGLLYRLHAMLRDDTADYGHH